MQINPGSRLVSGIKPDYEKQVDYLRPEQSADICRDVNQPMNEE